MGGNMRYIVNDLDSLFKKYFNYKTVFYFGLNNINNYISSILKLNYPIYLKPYIYLNVLDEQKYFTYRIRTLLEPICEVLNINYKELNSEEEFLYYKSLIETKLIELSKVNNLEVLQYKFPFIYDRYEKKRRDTEFLVRAYNTYLITIPKKQAKLTLISEIYSNGYNEEYFNKIISDASKFSLEQLIGETYYDMSVLYSNLDMLVSRLNEITIDTRMIYGLDLSLYNQKQKKKINDFK